MTRRIRAPLKMVAPMVAAMLLAACDNPYIRQFKQEFGWTEARMVSDGWLEGRRIPSKPSYCYETIAVADCYAAPRAEWKDQLIQDRQTPLPGSDF